MWENEKATHHRIRAVSVGWDTETFIEFTCGATLTVAVSGSILAAVKPDKMSETLTLKYKAKHGFQTPEYYEENGEKIHDVLPSDFAGKGCDQSGQTITSTVKNEEKLELNAYV